MKVERLIAGSFTAPAGIFRKDDDLDRTVRYPVPVYVIETREQRILVDTGLNPAAVADPAAYYERPDVFAVATLEQEQSIAEQLDLASLSKVVVTHLHWDHVGGLSLIPASVPLVIQRREWEAGKDPGAATSARCSYWFAKLLSPSPRPAASASQPIRFLGCREARTKPITGMAVFATSPKTSEKSQLVMLAGTRCRST